VDNDEFIHRLANLEKDMWFGNGKPGITTRMALMEDFKKDMQSTIRGMKEMISMSNKKTDRLTWLVAVGVGIVITLQFILKN